MSKGRLEAFSDGVLAIVITIYPLAAVAIDVAVAALWIVPDRRIERRLAEPN